MIRTATTVAVGFLAAIATSPSYSTDLGRPRPYVKASAYQPAYVAPFTWQGFYAGFNGGYGWGNSTLTGPTGITNTTNPAGALLGAGFGYNFQGGNWVIGIEGDTDYSWMRDTSDAVAPCPSCTVHNYYLATVRGRLGYAWDRWLPYVTGGAAIGSINVSTPAGGGHGTDNVGWTVGAGVEYAFAATRWSTKLEYLYADLGSMTCDATRCGTPVDADFHANVVRLGLNYHF
jgi:outer membrane immunogenic protein